VIHSRIYLFFYHTQVHLEVSECTLNLVQSTNFSIYFLNGFNKLRLLWGLGGKYNISHMYNKAVQNIEYIAFFSVMFCFVFRIYNDAFSLQNTDNGQQELPIKVGSTCKIKITILYPNYVFFQIKIRWN
jgi:hypothetical protein